MPFSQIFFLYLSILHRTALIRKRRCRAPRRAAEQILEKKNRIFWMRLSFVKIIFFVLLDSSAKTHILEKMRECVFFNTPLALFEPRLYMAPFQELGR